MRQDLARRVFGSGAPISDVQLRTFADEARKYDAKLVDIASDLRTQTSSLASRIVDLADMHDMTDAARLKQIAVRAR